MGASWPRASSWRHSWRHAASLSGKEKSPDLPRHRPEAVLVIQVSLQHVEPLPARHDGSADEVRHQHHAGAQAAEFTVERGVVEGKGLLEGESDGPRGFPSLDLDERQVQHMWGQERLSQSEEEDLHARVHEPAFGPWARLVQLDEPVHVGVQGVRSRQSDLVRTRLLDQATLLAPDLVAEF